MPYFAAWQWEIKRVDVTISDAPRYHAQRRWYIAPSSKVRLLRGRATDISRITPIRSAEVPGAERTTPIDGAHGDTVAIHHRRRRTSPAMSLGSRPWRGA